MSKVDRCGICGKRVLANSVLCVKCGKFDLWKMRESKDSDLEVGERFCVWKMQEAS